MAVTVVRPEDWRNADFVEVESDQKDNTRAILEIEDWADAHGYFRTREDRLVLALYDDGRRTRRAILYRPMREEGAATQDMITANRAALERQAAARQA